MHALNKKLMPRFMLSVLFSCTLSTSVWAVEQATPAATAQNTTTQAANRSTNTTATTASNTTPNKALTAEQLAKEKALIKDQNQRLQLLEKANLEALSQNQELQLQNDSLTVQVQVLQSESSAQMFLYGAATIVVGVILGFFIASYIYTKRRRQW